MISSSQSVATLVREHSECAEIFQRHRIDFCCRGALSIERAAQERGVDLAALLQELDGAVADRHHEPSGALRDLPTPALIDHIVDQHHAYLRRALPFLEALAVKVARVHGEHQPALRAVERAVAELAATLRAHLDDEETHLFPELESGGVPSGELIRDLAAMRDEHFGVAELLETIRGAGEDFVPPEWACASYRTLMSELAALERDLFLHIHLENHVLAPRFEPQPRWPGQPTDDLGVR